jgi:site-specific DNA recombinase
MVAIVYCRVSTEEQAQHGYSLGDQEKQGAEKARALGCDRIIPIADEGISGELLERPGLQRARELIRGGGVTYLVCKDADRLSRKLAHQLLLQEELDKHGTALVYLTFDRQANAEGSLLDHVRGAIAEYEKVKIKERTTAGRLAKARLGLLPHYAGCFGYIYAGKSGGLEINPDTAPWVERIFRWFTGLEWSCDRIAEELNALGVRTLRGALWSQTKIRRLVQNSTYKGDLLYNRSNQEGMRLNRYKPKAERKRKQPRPSAEHIHIPVPAIVDEETWDRAQEIIARRRRTRPGRSIEFYMLSGLLRCGVCGRPLMGLRTLWPGYSSYVRYYVCGGRAGHRYQGPRCMMPYKRAEALEEAVWGVVRGWIEDPEKYARATAQEQQTGDPGEAAMLAKQLREVEEQRGRLADLYIGGMLPKADMEARAKNLTQREGFLRGRIAELQPKKRQAERLDFQEVRGDLDNKTPEEKQAIIRAAIDRVIVYPDAGGRIKIVNREAAPAVNLNA